MSDENSHYGFDRSSKVMVSNTGKVIWTPLAILQTTCAIDVRNYPFDKQVCPITIEYMQALNTEVNITVPSVDINQFNLDINYIESSEWDLVNFVCIWNETKFGGKPQNKVTCHVEVK